MRGTVVIDLDGTLANIDHRLKWIQGPVKDWDAFFLSCDKDTVNPWCAELMDAMVEIGYDVVIVSARSQICADKTQEWLDKHFKWVPKLVLLRKVRDHRPDTILKEEWLLEQDKSKILFVVEDRRRVVEMWRKHGLVCLQCYEWPERAD